MSCLPSLHNVGRGATVCKPPNRGDLWEAGAPAPPRPAGTTAAALRRCGQDLDGRARPPQGQAHGDHAPTGHAPAGPGSQDHAPRRAQQYRPRPPQGQARTGHAPAGPSNADHAPAGPGACTAPQLVPPDPRGLQVGATAGLWSGVGNAWLPGLCPRSRRAAP